MDSSGSGYGPALVLMNTVMNLKKRGNSSPAKRLPTSEERLWSMMLERTL
jgi:hypothetical protein